MTTHDTVELYFVRHGQSTANLERRLSGWINPSLTSKGIDQAEALRPRLEGIHFDEVYASDLKRAIQTARLAWGNPIVEPALREMSYGDYDGLRFDEVDKAWLDALYRFKDLQTPGGESIDEVVARASHFLNGLSNGRYLLFCHGAIIRCLSYKLGQDRFIDNGSLLIIDWLAKEITEIWSNPISSFE